MPSLQSCWYHVILTTYGAWLDGDPRGFRTRRHKKHIEGDYTAPPPDAYMRRLRRSHELLKHEPVGLSPRWQPIVGTAVRDRLFELEIRVLAIAVAERHVHVQMRAPFGTAKRYAGFAKRHAWHVVRNDGWTGKLWAKGSKPVPIRTRNHQLRVFRYILRHRCQGAWVWHWRMGDERR
jgi:hypothetical protein